MKIGLLAYHSACNMGATLQLLSSYSYWQNHGHEPIVINWVAEDLEEYYRKSAPQCQIDLQQELRTKIWTETKLCRDAKDVASEIERLNIQAVVIGSDAVAQHHPITDQIIFPTRRIVSIRKFSSDRMFPNPFWGEFLNYLPKRIPVAVYSAASQDSDYKHFPREIKQQMFEYISRYSFMSVRDVPTREMMKSISQGTIVPDITPDPVFAFNQNAGALIPDKEYIMKKYNISGKYILCSFINKITVSQKWLNEFEKEVNKQGFECVIMPFSQKESFGTLKNTIHLPLSPLDWYALIKYSSGYVGSNMHPIIVALHNQIPFFSFDNYGQRKLNGLIVKPQTSKILHIVKKAGLTDNHVSTVSRFFTPPSPQFVQEKLKNFDTKKSLAFSEEYYNEYVVAMQNLERSLIND